MVQQGSRRRVLRERFSIIRAIPFVPATFVELRKDIRTGVGDTFGGEQEKQDATRRHSKPVKIPNWRLALMVIAIVPYSRVGVYVEVGWVESNQNRIARCCLA